MDSYISFTNSNGEHISYTDKLYSQFTRKEMKGKMTLRFYYDKDNGKIDPKDLYAINFEFVYLGDCFNIKAKPNGDIISITAKEGTKLKRASIGFLSVNRTIFTLFSLPGMFKVLGYELN